MLPRGIRNNNPGNLKRNKTAWRGLRPVQTDPSFFQYVSMADGIRACAVTLLSYYRVHNLTTVRGIINRYAPPFENDTSAYAEHIAGRLAVGLDDRIQCNPEVWDAMCDAIFEHENGSDAANKYISSADLLHGINMAFGVA